VDNVCADRIQKLACMRYQQHCARPPQQIVLQPQDSMQVQMVGRLIQEQQVRLHKQCSSESHPHAPTYSSSNQVHIKASAHQARAATNNACVMMQPLQPTQPMCNQCNQCNQQGICHDAQQTCWSEHKHAVGSVTSTSVIDQPTRLCGSTNQLYPCSLQALYSTACVHNTQ
jgi:hypothetical protein